MEKNIIVVDGQGREYEATYPKRAKGLVKQGRARFVDENKICLACPPDKLLKTDDIEMSENITNQEANTNKSTNYTIDYVLSKIAELQEQLSHLSPSAVGASVVQAIKSISETEDEDIDYNELAENISVPFCMREETYRKMFELYSKMYDNLIASEKRSKELQEKKELVEYIKELYHGNVPEDEWKSIVEYFSKRLLKD